MDIEPFQRDIRQLRQMCEELIRKSVEFGSNDALHSGTAKQKCELTSVINQLRFFECNDGATFASKKQRIALKDIQNIIASLILPEQLSVACLGPVATFSHWAATRYFFGGNCQFRLCDDNRDVFDRVARESVTHGVVALANTISGESGESYDLLRHYISDDVSICGEIFVPIHYHLISAGDIGDVELIVSHPQAIGQCRENLQRFVSENFNHPVKIENELSTSRAAERACEDKRVAALANELAAATWGLKPLLKHMEDKRSNMTRFIVIGKHPPPRSGNDRTTVVFEVKHRPGSLIRALAPLEAKINILSLTLRPSPDDSWAYTFFVDIQGHAEEEHIKQAIYAMTEVCRDGYPKVLGSYPRAEQSSCGFQPPRPSWT